MKILTSIFFWIILLEIHIHYVMYFELVQSKRTVEMLEVLTQYWKYITCNFFFEMQNKNQKHALSAQVHYHNKLA